MGVICLVHINTSCSSWGPNLSNSKIIPIKRFLDMHEMASVLTKCESEGLVLSLMIQWPFSYIYFSICSPQSFVYSSLPSAALPSLRATTTPHNDAGAEDALHHTPINSSQDWFPSLACLGVLRKQRWKWALGVVSLGETLIEVYTQELEAGGHFCSCSFNAQKREVSPSRYPQSSPWFFQIHALITHFS